MESTNKKMNKVVKPNISISEYLPLFFLLCFSGNPIVTSESYSKTLLVVYTLIFSIYALNLISWKLQKDMICFLISILSFISVIVIAQNFILGFVSYPGVLAIILKILLGLVTLIYYQHRRIDILITYIKILTFLAIISIPFFIINQFGFYGISTNNDILKSFLLFTSTAYLPSYDYTYKIIRNAGMFWEAGAFAGYLLVALIFIILKNKKFKIGKYHKESFWIFIAIVTTMSTAGFIILSIIILFYALQNYKWGKIVIAPAFILIIFLSYSNLSFMQKKIDSQIDEAIQMQSDEFSNSRFGSLIMDSWYIKSQPIFGNGLNIKTRYRFNLNIMNNDVGNGNGMSNFIVEWGIPFFIYWLYSVFRFIRKITNSISLSFTVLFLFILILQGEAFLNFPMFLMFFGISKYYHENIISNNKSAI